MPKIIDHDARRLEIAKAACWVLSRMGTQKTKLTEIGIEANCTTGAITHYFKNKDAVLDAAWDFIHDDVWFRLNQASKRKPYSLSKWFAEFLPLNEHGQMISKVWLALINRAIVDPVSAKAQIITSQNWVPKIARELKKAVDLGLIEPGTDIELETHAITIFINGISTRAILDPESWPAKRQIDMLNHYFARLVI